MQKSKIQFFFENMVPWRLYHKSLSNIFEAVNPERLFVSWKNLTQFHLANSPLICQRNYDDVKKSCFFASNFKKIPNLWDSATKQLSRISCNYTKLSMRIQNKRGHVTEFFEFFSAKSRDQRVKKQLKISFLVFFTLLGHKSNHN